ncbi:MAG TPA: tetratricopeptide repeat protein, partial [Sandaracinaceae bacterium]
MRHAQALLALALSLALASTVAAQRRARAQNPFDAEVRRLAAEVRRSARQPRAYVPLARMYDSWDRASPGLTTQLLGELGGDRRLPPALRAYASALRASLLAREGQVDRAAATFRELGFVTQMYVVGPFDNEGKAGFGRAMPPEQERNAPFDPSATYQGRERPVGWRLYPDVARFGYVNFGAVMRPNENACGFAHTFVHSERAQPLTLWIGAGGAVAAWFNGAEVLRDDAYRSSDYDRFVALVPARAGWNRVLVKVCNADGPFGLYLRLGDAEGAPARGVRVDPDGAREAAPAPASAPSLPRAPVAALAGLHAEVAARPESAQAHEDLARFLAATYADDPAQRRALEHAQRAAELGPTVERWLLVAALRSERGEVMRAVDEAERISPTHPEVLYQRAVLVATGPDPDRALAILDRIDPNSTSGMLAHAFRAAIYGDLGLPRAALAEVDRALARAPGTAFWLRRRLAALEGLGRVEESMRLRERILEVAHDDADARQAIVNDALARHDRARVLAEVEAARALNPDDTETIGWAAALYEALGMVEQALSARREAIELTPENADAFVAYGRTLLRHDQTDAAADAFRRALALRPQDEEVRALLEEIRPSAPRRDETFAAPTEEVLA